MSEFTQQLSLDTPAPEVAVMEPAEKAQEAFRFAMEQFGRNPDWITFFREVLGVGGIVRRMFPNPQELAVFEQGPMFAEIQQMLARLREKSKHPEDCDEPTRVITVRLPKSLHELLRHEAHERKTSMNQLCISKLLQLIDEKLVPTD
jgi:predicted HicB family RNase H-like nuclease